MPFLLEPLLLHPKHQNKIFYLSSDDVLKLNLEIDDNEKNTQDLWITFFNTIGIKERKNSKCQMNFMPKKYWSNIIEMEDKL